MSIAWKCLPAAALVLMNSIASAATPETAGSPRVARFLNETQVELADGGARKIIRQGESFGAWTLMAVVSAEQPYAVLEDFKNKDGRMLFIDANGVRTTLTKTLESSAVHVPDTYLGISREDVLASATDVLGNRILATQGDPDYQQIASIFPPIRKIKGNTYNFVGTPDTLEKIGFAYGGRTANFDPAVYHPSIESIRKDGKVWDGLVGGYLPVLRFIYPQDDGDWTEMIAFAPWRIVNGNNRVQPVWYRVSRIENAALKWSLYVDSYHPFLPGKTADPRAFYSDLAKLEQGWDEILSEAMRIDIPDERVSNMARFGLVRAIMTRAGDFPKYGAVDKDYGGSEHDGFPDTFTVETTAMIEWGLLERAGRYIDNYFGHYVRDDGSILYRGPETGQFGRMLTVLAQYVNAGGNADVLLRQRTRIDGVTKLLLSLRAKALTLPASDPAYGMIAGWSEADSSLEKDPQRYMQPYFSNSTEAARGMRDLGRAWEAIGRKRMNDELIAWGQQLVREATTLRKDIDVSISKSLLHIDGKAVLPAIAGVKEPPHVAARRDSADPQFRAYRTYMEMLYSGNLTSQQASMIVDYRSNHHDMILGVPTAYGYGSGEIAGFLSYGHGYGLIQTDRIREALLLMYSVMAHQYTRGSWMAPETRRPLLTEEAAPYCTPAQLVATLMTRWLLVFEDPESDILWLGKAMPRQWLQDGKTITVAAAATRWGRVGFSITSRARKGTISAQLSFPDQGLSAETRLRLRTENGARMKSVTLNGKPWKQFDPPAKSSSCRRECPGRSMSWRVIEWLQQPILYSSSPRRRGSIRKKRHGSPPARG